MPDRGYGKGMNAEVEGQVKICCLDGGMGMSMLTRNIKSVEHNVESMQ